VLVPLRFAVYQGTAHCVALRFAIQ